MIRKRADRATALHIRNTALRHVEKAEGEPLKKVAVQEMVVASIYTGTTYIQQQSVLIFSILN